MGYQDKWRSMETAPFDKRVLVADRAGVCHPLLHLKLVHLTDQFSQSSARNSIDLKPLCINAFQRPHIDRLS
jgi:hypothetical protein